MSAFVEIGFIEALTILILLYTRLSYTRIYLLVKYYVPAGCDIDGKVSCAAEEVGNEQQFTLETQADGKVAVRSVPYGRYFGGTGDQLNATPKEVSNTTLWTFHLAMHPQINLRNVNRKTYAHLKGAEVCVDTEIPWGADAMIVLEFHEGRYAIRLFNKKYLTRTGSLTDNLSDDSLFVLVFRDAQVAFRDCKGKYLTAVGASATMQSRKDTIGKDELFVLEDSHPQCTLLASAANKYASIRSSQEVKANQTEVTHTEVFQLEATDRTDRSGKVKWVIRANNKKYWSCETNNVVADGSDATKSHTHFDIEWHNDKIALMAYNGKYVVRKANGQLSATGVEANDDAFFVFEMINRPILVLRGEYGFVGTKGAAATLECNRSQYDIFEVEPKDGAYFLAKGGKYWKLEDGDSTITCTSSQPVPFHLELRAHTHLCIRAPNGSYVAGEQHGGFKAVKSTIDNSTLWEY